jgi:cell division transport system ATP-binding protein
LADEPTGNLDSETGQEIVKLLHSFSEKGTLVIVSTHNLHLVKKFSGKVYRFEDKMITDVTSEYEEEDNLNNKQ